MGKVGESALSSEQVGTPEVRSYPELTLAILINRPHHVAAQRVRIGRVVCERHKLPQGLIIARQACSIGSNPERARVIDKHRGQPVGRNTKGIVFGVAVTLKTGGLLVVSIQTATISSNPDVSLA